MVAESTNGYCFNQFIMARVSDCIGRGLSMNLSGKFLFRSCPFMLYLKNIFIVLVVFIVLVKIIIFFLQVSYFDRMGQNRVPFLWGGGLKGFMTRHIIL